MELGWFLTPFKVEFKQQWMNMFTRVMIILSGEEEVNEGEVFKEKDFNKGLL